ncbi:MAG: (2Fe-2S)-binding protein [Bryobacterales bacterium]|nr:(2Fe-2S)-binding protein [Bryobacterales bacterium]
MPEKFLIRINGTGFQAARGMTVAAAVLMAGVACFRRSVSGEPRAPLCGMGICMECRVTIDGVPHSRACQTLCAPGMEIRTDA